MAKHRDNFDNILIDELSNLVDNFGQQLLFDEYLPFVGRQVYIIGVPWQKDVDDINIFGWFVILFVIFVEGGVDFRKGIDGPAI